MADPLIANFVCPMCLDVAKDAVESSCCNHVFCRQCFTVLTQQNGMFTLCPLCRAVLKCVEVPLIRRIINDLPWECPSKCNTPNLRRSDMEKHLNSLCPHIPKCEFPDCTFRVRNEEDMLKHVIDAHGTALLANLKLLAYIHSAQAKGPSPDLLDQSSKNLLLSMVAPLRGM